VLRIRDVYPGSWILIFTHPGSRIQKQQQKRALKRIGLGSGIRKKPIPDVGSKRRRIPDPQHCFQLSTAETQSAEIHNKDCCCTEYWLLLSEETTESQSETEKV
jgi:hypothetical protein